MCQAVHPKRASSCSGSSGKKWFDFLSNAVATAHQSTDDPSGSSVPPYARSFVRSFVVLTNFLPTSRNPPGRTGALFRAKTIKGFNGISIYFIGNKFLIPASSSPVIDRPSPFPRILGRVGLNGLSTGRKWEIPSHSSQWLCTCVCAVDVPDVISQMLRLIFPAFLFFCVGHPFESPFLGEDFSAASILLPNLFSRDFPVLLGCEKFIAPGANLLFSSTGPFLLFGVCLGGRFSGAAG